MDIDDDREGLEPWPDGKVPVIGQAKAGKRIREIRSLWRRINAAGVTVPSTLHLIRETDVSTQTPVKDFHDVLARCKSLRHFTIGAEAAKGVKPPADDDDDEPPAPPVSADDPKAPAAAAAAPSAPPDELEQTRLALRHWRRNAGLTTVVARVRPYRPDDVLQVLDGLVTEDEHGDLLLVDGNKRLPLSEKTLRRVIPPELLPPGDGRADTMPGGSGGGTPLPAPRAPAGRDLIERATKSQGFFDANRDAVNAELARRQREGGD